MAQVLHTTRRCLDCDYPLEHLNELRCPECGRAFDPRNPETFTVEQRPTNGWLIATGVVWVYPLLWFLFLHLTWVVGWIQIGHAPRPSLDDPKMISILSDLLVFLSLVAAGFTPVALMCGFVANLWLGSVYRLRLGRHVLLHGSFLLCWCAQIALIRLDPLRVGEWILD